MTKTPREVAREVDALLAAGSSKSKEWQDGFKYGAEAARDEWRGYGRATVRATLDQLRAFARNDFDLGQVAGYEDALTSFSLSDAAKQQRIGEIAGHALAARWPKRGGDVKVDTSIYRRYHGAEPRGRGDWTFVIGKLEYERTDDPAIYRPSVARGVPDLPYSKAREHAIAEARRRGASLVSVGP